MEDNHYQFYINFPRLCIKLIRAASAERSKTNIISWLESISIDRTAYNVVISPLHETNTFFLSAVIAHVFGGNVRIINIPVHESFRDNIRAKYGFITEECIRIRRSDPLLSSVKTYFVDNAIVNGKTAERSRSILRMLISPAMDPTQADAPYIFTKVILLVNRSSYETLADYVRQPNADVNAYMYLAPPQYNTHADNCPACMLPAKYELLMKRSATLEVSQEFRRLANKHQKQTPLEYETWISSQIKANKSYFGWLKQWLAFCNVESGELSGQYISFTLSDADKEAIGQLRNTVQNYIEEHDSQHSGRNFPLCEVIKDTTKLNDAVRIIRKFLIAKRDYMRLECMHKAYVRLVHSNNFGNQDVEETFNEMLRLIAGSLGELDSIQAVTNNVEWIISYVKILSREHIAKYYVFRCAISRIMRTIFDFMLLDKAKTASRYSLLCEQNSEWALILKTLRPNISLRQGSREERLCPILRYQFFMMLVLRMADLQMNAVVEKDNLCLAVIAYNKLREEACAESMDSSKYDAITGSMYSEFPEPKDAALRYLRTIKNAVMSTDNDALCFELNNTYYNLSNAEGSTALGDFSPFIDYLKIENTRMLYDGISLLSKRVNTQKKDDAKIDVETIIKSAFALNGMDPNFKQPLQMNPLYYFLRFWEAGKYQPELEHGSYGIFATLVRYFCAVKALCHSEFNDATPYDYENLCRLLYSHTKTQTEKNIRRLWT